jgi:hypothetical protein
MQHAIKRAVQSAYENFASPRSTTVAQLLILLLLGLIGVSVGQHLDEKAIALISFDERQ